MPTKPFNHSYGKLTPPTAEPRHTGRHGANCGLLLLGQLFRFGRQRVSRLFGRLLFRLHLNKIPNILRYIFLIQAVNALVDFIRKLNIFLLQIILYNKT